MTSNYPTMSASDIEWLSLRGALQWSTQVSKPILPVAHAKIHVVDVLEPLEDGVLEKLKALPADSLVIILSTGTHSDSPSRIEKDLLAAEEAVKEATPAAWVVLRCSPFVQEFVGSVRASLNESIFAAWEEREIPWLDFDDVVDLALVLSAEPGRRNRTYELTGGECLSPRDLTDFVAETCEVPFHYVLLGADQVIIGMRRGGTSPALADRRAHYMSFTTGPHAFPMNDTVRRALGREPGSPRTVVQKLAAEAYDFSLKLYETPDSRSTSVPQVTDSNESAGSGA